MNIGKITFKEVERLYPKCQIAAVSGFCNANGQWFTLKEESVLPIDKVKAQVVECIDRNAKIVNIKLFEPEKIDAIFADYKIKELIDYTYADISKLPDWQQTEPMAHLQAWMNENTPSEEMKYKQGFLRQTVFVRDTFCILFQNEIKSLEVISTHTSKSILLPVYCVNLNFNDHNYIKFVLRDNFHDWKISVSSTIDLHFPTEMFSKNGEEQNHNVYCEGFEESWIYGPYVKNQSKFTVEIYNNELLYMFLFMIKLQMEGSRFFEPFKKSLSSTSVR